MTGVDYDLAAFRRAEIGGPGGGLMELQVEASLPRDAVFSALSTAIGEANARLAQEEAAGRELYAAATGPTPGPRGPVATFHECEPAAALRLYLHVVATSLERQGVSGRLVPLREQEADRWFSDYAFGALSAVLQLPVDVAGVLATYDPYPHQPTRGWWVGEPATRDVIAPLVTWTLGAGDHRELMHGFTRSPPGVEDVTSSVLTGIFDGHHVQLRAWSGPGHMRQLKTGRFGSVLVQSYDPEVTRRAHLDDLTEVLERAAPRLSTAWIQEADTLDNDRTAVLASSPLRNELADAVGNRGWWLFHLQDDHVFDAFVTQVLNDEQLARATDLDPTRWTVTDLGAGRHLVQHRDPDRWFDRDPVPLPQRPRGAGPRDRPIHAPDPAVLSQARKDFGSAIMTRATLRERPFVEPQTGRLLGA